MNSETTSINFAEKDLIIFDLDGTLAPSKSAIDPAMAQVLERLLEKKRVAIISGGRFEQFKKQLLGHLTLPQELLKRLIIVPTSGTQMYMYEGNEWKELYDEQFSPEERAKIMAALNDVLNNPELYEKPAQTWGPVVEDRKSEITFSALGQEAPIEAKQTWDPDHAKRKKMADVLLKQIPEFSIGMGGMTSLDITRKGIDKAYGIHKLEKFFQIPISKMLFVGDALMEGGNDYPARSTGVDCVSVIDPHDTQQKLEEWLK